MEEIVRKSLKETGLGLLYMVFIIVLNRYFGLSTWGLIGLLVIGSVLISIITKSFNIKSILKSSIVISIVVWIFSFLGRWGAGGYTLGIAITCSLIMFGRRKKFMEAKHHIETLLFGKPLYKYREEHKKPPKISIGF